MKLKLTKTPLQVSPPTIGYGSVIGTQAAQWNVTIVI